MALNGTDLDAAFNMGRRPTSGVPSNYNHHQAATVAATTGVPNTRMSAAMGMPDPHETAPQAQPQPQPPPTPQPPPKPVVAVTPAKTTSASPVIEQFSYIDSLITKKKDLGRLILFALTIVFAVAIHAFVQFTLKEISIANTLTFKQELGVRLIYPVVALLMIWFIRASFK